MRRSRSRGRERAPASGQGWGRSPPIPNKRKRVGASSFGSLDARRVGKILAQARTRSGHKRSGLDRSQQSWMPRRGAEGIGPGEPRSGGGAISARFRGRASSPSGAPNPHCGRRSAVHEPSEWIGSTVRSRVEIDSGLGVYPVAAFAHPSARLITIPRARSCARFCCVVLRAMSL